MLSLMLLARFVNFIHVLSPLVDANATILVLSTHPILDSPSSPPSSMLFYIPRSFILTSSYLHCSHTFQLLRVYPIIVHSVFILSPALCSHPISCSPCSLYPRASVFTPFLRSVGLCSYPIPGSFAKDRPQLLL